MHKIITPLFFVAALLTVSYCANKSMVARAGSEIRELKLDKKEPEAGYLGVIEERAFNPDIPILIKNLPALVKEEIGKKAVAEQEIAFEINTHTDSSESKLDTQANSRDLEKSAKDESEGLSSDFFEREQGFNKKENLSKNKEMPWQKIRPGLEYILLPELRGESFVIVAISPELYAFTLHMASEEGEARSLKTWAKQHGLLVAINASMYLPDLITSTGHMKSSTHVNNEYIGSRLGAFFVAEPRQKNLALVDILETDDKSWRERFEQYELRVQNFRILSRDGTLQWKDASSRHSVAAIGKNSRGKVFFILATRAMSIPDFANRLKESLADLSSVIYVEGSDKAALYLQLSADTEYLWQGRKNVFNFPADPHMILPNIIGVRARNE